MPSPTDRVLQTYELLEKILRYLPIHDLFAVSRVSKQWHSILRRSVSLQQEQFLNPNSEPLKPFDSPYNTTGGRTRALYNPVPVRLNPAAAVLGLVNDTPANNRIPLATFGISDQNMFLQFELTGLPIYEKRILSEDASWRRMFLTQPPVVAVNLDFIRREEHGGSVTVWDKEGVRFGLVQEWLVRLAEEYEIETGKSAETTFVSVSFCLMHPFSGDQMEEAW